MNGLPVASAMPLPVISPTSTPPIRPGPAAAAIANKNTAVRVFTPEDGSNYRQVDNFGLKHRTIFDWLDDALNVGTIIVLTTLVFSSFPWWSLPISASPLTDIALIYCGGLILTAMWRSILKPGR